MEQRHLLEKISRRWSDKYRWDGLNTTYRVIGIVQIGRLPLVLLLP